MNFRPELITYWSIFGFFILDLLSVLSDSELIFALFLRRTVIIIIIIVIIITLFSSD